MGYIIEVWVKSAELLGGWSVMVKVDQTVGIYLLIYSSRWDHNRSFQQIGQLYADDTVILNIDWLIITGSPLSRNN